MSFGLANAPAHFERVVAGIVDLGDIQVVVYLDDVVVYGDDPYKVWEETLIVLRRLT